MNKIHIELSTRRRFLHSFCPISNTALLEFNGPDCPQAFALNGYSPRLGTLKRVIYPSPPARGSIRVHRRVPNELPSFVTRHNPSSRKLTKKRCLTRNQPFPNTSRLIQHGRRTRGKRGGEEGGDDEFLWCHTLNVAYRCLR